MRPPSNLPFPLTNENALIPRELVRRDLQVERRRALPDATTHVIVTSVARAEPSVVVPRAGDGHAAEVRADAEDDEPLGLLDALGVGLLVAELAEAARLGVGDLGVCSVADEDGLAAPLYGDGGAGVDVAELELGGGEREDVGGGGHRGDELDQNDAGGGRVHEASAA